MPRLRPQHSVFVRPTGSRWFVQVEWNGLGGTAFYVRARSKEHAQALFDTFIECPDVAGVSLFIAGRFVGARDGAGS